MDHPARTTSAAQWQRVASYLERGQLLPARALLESILAREPQDARARTALGAVYVRMDHPRAAAAAVQAAAKVPLEDAQHLYDLASTAITVGEAALARDLLQRPPLAQAPAPSLLTAVAVQWQLLGDNRAALAVLERARGAGADDLAFHFQYGVQLGFNGDLAGAVREFGRCIRFDPPPGYAFLRLAHLRQPGTHADHLAAIDGALARAAAGSIDTAALHFARYLELEGAGDFDAAWTALERGNAIAHALCRYDSNAEAASIDGLLQRCTPAFLHSPTSVRTDGPQPIFIIGMTRSGTTVLERILGNHSAVACAGELAAFPQALTHGIDHWVPAGMPDTVTLSRLPQADWDLVARHYAAQNQWRARGRRFYVDKLPRNWIWAGLIHKTIPRARIINLVRAPLDVCFSNWRALLGVAPGYGYAYDVDCLAAHHRQYRRTLAHWHHVMPDTILDVDYQRLVRAPTTVAREVLDFCGLDYEPGCEDITRNTAPSATLSTTQIRQPVRASATPAWAPYADKLAVLSKALESTA